MKRAVNLWRSLMLNLRLFDVRPVTLFFCSRPQFPRAQTGVYRRIYRIRFRTTLKKRTTPRLQTKRPTTSRTRSRAPGPSGADRGPPSRPSSSRRSRPPSWRRQNPRGIYASSWRRRRASTCVSSRWGTVTRATHQSPKRQRPFKYKRPNITSAHGRLQCEISQ